MPDDLGHLYRSLYPRAYEISSRSVWYLCQSDIEECAHDITVDFLMYSRSYAEVYDPSLGGLLPFFSSYVRKKMRRIWENVNSDSELSRLDEPGMEDALGYVAGFEMWLEVRSVLSRVLCLVRDTSFCGVNVGSVLKAGVREIMDKGRVTVRGVCVALGTSNRKAVRRCLTTIQNKLSEVGGSREPTFYVCKRRPKKVGESQLGEGCKGPFGEKRGETLGSP